MEWIVTTGATVEDAKERALDELGIDELEAEFVVEEEPRAGLFGRTRGEARVRARVRPSAPPPKVERRERRANSRKRKQKDKRGADAASTAATKPEAESSPAPAPTPAAEQPPAARAEQPPDPPAAEDPPTSQPTKEQPVSDITLEQQGEVVADFLSGLLDAFDLDGEIETNAIDDENMEVAVVGDNLGLLIGQKGATLQAIGELARAASMQALAGRHPGRVHIDVAGYRQKRRDALADFTRKVATEVIESGVAKALEPMSAADRKVVHDTVNDIDGATTISEGEDPRRRVVIEPA